MHKNIFKNEKSNKLSKKLNFLNKKETNTKKIKFQDLKANNKTKRDKMNNDSKLKMKNSKFNVNKKENNIKSKTLDLINDIKKNDILLEKIKYLQLWWKTIFHIIKIQKYLRGFLKRVKLVKLKQLNGKIYLLSKSIKRIIYRMVIGKMKNINSNIKLKISSPEKEKNRIKNNSINNDFFSFEKIFLTSRKLHEKQKPKIKQDKTKVNNINLPQQHSSTKRKNLNNYKERNNIKVSKNLQSKKICQCFNTSSNFISNTKSNTNNSKNKNFLNNAKVNKIEISHKVANKAKKIIKYRNEIDNNLNKFKSYRPESLKNKSAIKGLDSSIKNDSTKKKNLELEYILTHELRFDSHKTLFNLYGDTQKQNNKNIIRVQKRSIKKDINEENNNLRSKSLENRSSNKKYKSFYSKDEKNEKNNSLEAEEKNISDFIKVINNNNVKKDMINWLHSWEKKNIDIKKRPSNKNNIKNIYSLANKIISFNFRNNGSIFFNNLKILKNLIILKSNFDHYKNVVILRKILQKLKMNQQAKINEEKKENEKLNLLEKLILKYTSLRMCLVKWKKVKNRKNKYDEENYINYIKSNSKEDLNTNDDFIDTSTDYFNKSQPEINSLRINNYNFIKNKYNISNLKTTKDKNNINININYNLITNNNSLEQGIYVKKKINIPKYKKCQNKSCIIGENSQEYLDNNIINEQKEFMNNSMITRKKKKKKKENNVYFPKHIKSSYNKNDIEYLNYKNNSQFASNKNYMGNKYGVINKRINLRYQQIFDS